MEKDQLKELFNETFNHFEQEVRPELWSSLANKINVSTASGLVATKGISLFSKIMIASALTSLLVFIGVVLTNQPKTHTHQSVIKTQEQKSQDTLVIRQNETSKKTNSIDFCVSPKKQEALLDSAVFLIEEATPFEMPKEALTHVVKSSTGKSEQKEGIQLKEEKGDTKLPMEFIQELQAEKQAVTNQTEKEDCFLGELPNVFTPNKDGINDVFLIDSKGLIDFSIVILDKNNRIVFQSNNPDFTWDGIALDGQECEMNHYVYFITAKSSNGKMITQHHLLTLQR